LGNYSTIAGKSPLDQVLGVHRRWCLFHPKVVCTCVWLICWEL